MRVSHSVLSLADGALNEAQMADFQDSMLTTWTA